MLKTEDLVIGKGYRDRKYGREYVLLSVTLTDVYIHYPVRQYRTNYKIDYFLERFEKIDE